ncbi:MAG: hypothetical protein V1875_04165 [Candidatus Altiarchaeota archaeon]
MKTRASKRHPAAGKRQLRQIIQFGGYMAISVVFLIANDMAVYAIIPTVLLGFSIFGIMGLMKARAARERH